MSSVSKSPQYEGDYTCTARSTAGMTNHTVTLTITAPEQSNLTLILSATLGCSLLLLVCIVCFVMWQKQLKKSREKKVRPTVQVFNKWEVLPQKLQLMEEIGEGAFGKVFKATLDNSLYPHGFVDQDLRYQGEKETVVAVKIAHDIESLEAKDLFREEIEVMKRIGKHRNIVSMIGCVTLSEPLQLILEYAPYGNLLSWLRKRRPATTRDNPVAADAIPEHMYKRPRYASFNVAVRKPEAESTADAGDCDGGGDGGSCSGFGSAAGGASSVVGGIGGGGGGAGGSGTAVLEDYNKNDGNLGMGSKQSLVSTERDHETTGVHPLPPHPGHATNVTGILVEVIQPRHRSPNVADDCDGSEDSASSSSEREDLEGPTDDPVTDEQLLSIAWQVAQGMEYLSTKGLVHRDLAARNVLISDHEIMKITDFGMTRMLYEEVYQTQTKKKMPIKWMAPEALRDLVFTTQSDVWSYGILLWEMTTFGACPYPGLHNKEVVDLLASGYRLDRPEMCSEELYDIMMQCWREDPEARPGFAQIRDQLEHVMQKDKPYLDINDESPNINEADSSVLIV